MEATRSLADLTVARWLSIDGVMIGTQGSFPSTHKVRWSALQLPPGDLCTEEEGNSPHRIPVLSVRSLRSLRAL